MIIVCDVSQRGRGSAPHRAGASASLHSCLARVLSPSRLRVIDSGHRLSCLAAGRRQRASPRRRISEPPLLYGARVKPKQATHHAASADFAAGGASRSSCSGDLAAKWRGVLTAMAAEEVTAESGTQVTPGHWHYF